MNECTPPEMRPEWTGRKRQVLELLARGKTNAEIADALGVSLAGVKWHVSEVLSILGVDSREEAAEYWRRERPLSARARRALRALAGPVFTVKTALGAAGLAGVAGLAVVVASLPREAQPAPGTPPTATLEVAAQPSDRPVAWDLEYVDIMTTQLSNGESETFAASKGDQLCFRTTRSSWTGGAGYGCSGHRTQFAPSLLLQHGGGKNAIFRGSVPDTFTRVEIELYDAPPIVPVLVDPPDELGFGAKFWAAEVPRGELVAAIHGYDATGLRISNPLYDPPGTPPRPQITAPLRDLILIGSQAHDAYPANPFGEARGGAIADPAGGTYRFRVEHDGNIPLSPHIWCQTGFHDLEWEQGPDSVGNGILTVDIPPDSAGCFFLITGGDGAYRISAISGP